LKELKDLEVLSLGDKPSITDAGLVHVRGMTCLRALHWWTGCDRCGPCPLAGTETPGLIGPVLPNGH
jgi:hypothetical protein